MRGTWQAAGTHKLLMVNHRHPGLTAVYGESECFDEFSILGHCFKSGQSEGHVTAKRNLAGLVHARRPLPGPCVTALSFGCNSFDGTPEPTRCMRHRMSHGILVYRVRDPES